MRNFKWSNGKIRSVTRNPDYYFHEAITWPKITSGKFNVRYRVSGSIHDTAGNEAFSKNHKDLINDVGFLNTNVAQYILDTLNPTINAQIGDFGNIPVLFENVETVYQKTMNNIKISKEDWDSSEISWDFKQHPLLNHIADDKQLFNAKLLEYSYVCAKIVTTVPFGGLK
ncbi:restriction enzyme [Companilactobacillus alimentarius DSM 20249]|nr:restriction enzyme [Companilactobacillus alimentarius DSM 20249]